MQISAVVMRAEIGVTPAATVVMQLATVVMPSGIVVMELATVMIPAATVVMPVTTVVSQVASRPMPAGSEVACAAIVVTHGEIVATPPPAGVMEIPAAVPQPAAWEPPEPADVDHGPESLAPISTAVLRAGTPEGPGRSGASHLAILQRGKRPLWAPAHSPGFQSEVAEVSIHF